MQEYVPYMGHQTGVSDTIVIFFNYILAQRFFTIQNSRFGAGTEQRFDLKFYSISSTNCNQNNFFSKDFPQFFHKRVLSNLSF